MGQAITADSATQEEDLGRILLGGARAEANGTSRAWVRGAVDDAVSRLRFEAARHEQEELARVAERLHDGPLQLALTAMQDLHDLDEGLEVDLDATIGMLREAVLAMRSLNSELYANVLRDDGLRAALGRVADDARRRGGPPVQLVVDGDTGGRHDALLVALAAELLANVRKHARATQVVVRVARDAPTGDVRLTVADDGVGMDERDRTDAVADGHTGLLSVRRRVHGCGGTVSFEAAAIGTSVRVSLPAERESLDAGPTVPGDRRTQRGDRRAQRSPGRPDRRRRTGVA